MTQTTLASDHTGALPPLPITETLLGFAPLTLYVTVDADGLIKMGTCAHCIIDERLRPDRSWDTSGDQDLDFDRETLFASLAELGITLTHRQAYVCP